MDSCREQNTHFFHKAIAFLMLPFSFMMMAVRLIWAIYLKIYKWANVKIKNLYKKLRSTIQRMRSIFFYPINKLFGNKAVPRQETYQLSKKQDEAQITKELILTKKIEALERQSAKNQEARIKLEQQIFDVTRQLSLRDGELLREKKASLEKLEELEKTKKLLNSQQEDMKVKDNKIFVLEEIKTSLETEIDWLKLQMDKKSTIVPQLESKLQHKQNDQLSNQVEPQKKNQSSPSNSGQPSTEQQKDGTSNEPAD